MKRGWWLDRAENLAVFRIVVAFVILNTRDVHTAASWASFPQSARVAPFGLHALLSIVPVTPNLAIAAYAAVIAGALFALVGLFTRTSFGIVALAAAYLLAIPQLSGTVIHTHHLVWFAALLATSPCADALSVDAWWLRRRSRAAHCELEAAVPYGVPIRVAWLLIAMMFFFPGLWKLRVSGVDWVSSENFRNQLYWKWYQTPGLRPPFRIDHYPRLCVLAAASAIALEISFPLLILRRTSRRLAVAAALGFQAFTALFMGIDFSILWACYPVFFDWYAITGRFYRRVEPPVCVSRRSAVPSIVSAIALLSGVAITGWLGITAGWPFACYPTFAHRVPATMPVLQIEVLDASGRARRIPPAALVEHGDWSRYWGLGWSLTTAVGSAASRARIGAYWRSVAGRPGVRVIADGSARVRFYRAEIPVDPDRRDDTPGTRQLIDEIPIQ